jgi:hypothetical protein
MEQLKQQIAEMSSIQEQQLRMLTHIAYFLVTLTLEVLKQKLAAQELQQLQRIQHDFGAIRNAQKKEKSGHATTI